MGDVIAFFPRLWVFPRRLAVGFIDLFARSVRMKLLAMVLTPLLIGVPVLLLIVWVWGTEGYNHLLVNKVSADLGTARQYFDRVQGGVLLELEGLASSNRLAIAMDQPDPARLHDLLAGAAQMQGLDYLLLLDAQGRVIAASGPTRPDAPRPWAVVHDALAGTRGYGLEVFSPAQLAELDPALPDRAHLDLLATRVSNPAPRTVENRGLMIQAAMPITAADGRIQAVLEGGVLLNGNAGIVDRLNAVVYQDASLPLGSQGTATLFLDDVRIATNVRLFQDLRALGTLCSPPVHERVITQGQVWLGSAFVVNDTYISGYQPLTNPQGQRIGMLYVGFLQAPLHHALYQALAGLVAAFILVSAVGTLAGLRWAQAIFRPLEGMDAVIRRINDGDDCARIGAHHHRRDEVGQLSRAFDHVLDSLTARQAEIQRWGQELDHKVAERTALLEQANTTLRRAQQQLVMNEKLTAIGELTAGVAHEINNPVAVILGNLDVLREILGDQARPVAQEIRLIEHQADRIQDIITRLLQFARPGDFAGQADPTQVDGVIADCLMLTRHNMNRSKVQVVSSLTTSILVEINQGELQQVLINLMMNAIQAMPDGGTLTVNSRDATPMHSPAGIDGFTGVMIRIGDTGQGIAPGDLDRIFDPFFTTKKQTGTGLGLSISYAIIQRYGGRIDVDSAPGQGTRFTLWLRQQARYRDQPPQPFFVSRFSDGDDG